MARRMYDDDWDDFEVLEEEERPAGVLTTTRILVGLVVVVVIAIVVARLALAEKPEYGEVAPSLFGLWTTSYPEFNDRYVEFRKHHVIFGTGGTGVVKFKVTGMDADKVGENDHYIIYYRDLAGTRHRVGLLLERNGNVLRFTDSAEARWTRYED